MLQRLQNVDRNVLAGIGIVLAVILFFSVNIFASNALESARADLTDDNLYTLSEGTRQMLATIDEPITLRFYKSAQIEQLGPYIVSHAERVGEVLDEYARLANGKLRIERYDPQPFSPEEDLAVADGLEGTALGADGAQAYFGLAGTNSTDDIDTIPFLAPERANFLEYDLTRLVYNLSNPEKTVVGVIGDLPLRGTQYDNYTPWLVLDQLRQFFDLRFLFGELDKIEDDVGILMLVHPQKLNERTMYAIDQFVMRGGRVLAFFDPFAEALKGRLPPQQEPPDTSVEDMEPFLTAWGVQIAPDKFVGDRKAARQVQGMDRQRPVVAPYLAWITMEQGNLNHDDVVMADVRRLIFNSAGGIEPLEGATTSLEPLVVTSPDSAYLQVAKIKYMPNPVELLNEFEPGDKSLTIAARITGQVKSAFPDGPPETVEDEDVKAAHMSEAEAPLNLILVADGDMLANFAWARTQQVLGQRYAIPVASNADFVLAALDNLSGSEGLMGLRGRGLTLRPFEVLQAMEAEAESKYRTKEQELLAKIEETQNKIVELQQREQEGGVLLTAEQQETIENFRVEMIDMRRELREVQHALRQDVGRLETELRLANIWAVPVIIAFVAIVLALVRRVRAAKFQASVTH